jgi:hypothetical protein
MISLKFLCNLKNNITMKSYNNTFKIINHNKNMFNKIVVRNKINVSIPLSGENLLNKKKRKEDYSPENYTTYSSYSKASKVEDGIKTIE